ncbi:MAG: hypothetical protein V4614_07905 [Pseudomonadota bacterium]
MIKNHDVDAAKTRTGDRARIAWVGFLAACCLEGLVFSVVDPGEVHWSGRVPQPSRQGIYTLAFFCFWIISSASAWLALWLAAPQTELNDTAVD